MMIDWNTVIIPALFGAGYWAVGFLEAQLQAPKESFDVYRTIRTLASGLVIGFTQGLAGITVDPSTVTTFGAVNGLLVVTLNKILNVYSAAPAAAAPAAPATVSPSVSTPAGGWTGAPAAAGAFTILGIYGGSAYSNPPKPTYSCDVNQVPMMFFDVLWTVAGKVMMAITIDGAPLKDWQLQGVDQHTIGTKQAFDFWIPQEYRVPGNHIIAISTGQLVATGTNWDIPKVFSLTFTGVKPLE